MPSRSQIVDERRSGENFKLINTCCGILAPINCRLVLSELLNRCFEVVEGLAWRSDERELDASVRVSVAELCHWHLHSLERVIARVDSSVICVAHRVVVSAGDCFHDLHFIGLTLWAHTHAATLSIVDVLQV